MEGKGVTERTLVPWLLYTSYSKQKGFFPIHIKSRLSRAHGLLSRAHGLLIRAHSLVIRAHGLVIRAHGLA